MKHILCLSLLMLMSALANASEAIPSAARQAELRHLLRQDCGACHGMTLNGGLGSALHADALRDKDDAILIATILYGRVGTAMPPWKNFLSEAEAAWLLRELRATPAPVPPSKTP